MKVAALPERVEKLCIALHAPKRLVAHLRLVHDTAEKLIKSITKKWPSLRLDIDAILFGAATHDLGKVLHPEELIGPGNLHERDGPQLLLENGSSPELARFSRTHGQWQNSNVKIEDLVVALADSIWKGARRDTLELRVTKEICAACGDEPWQAFQKLDRILTQLAEDASERLEWQRIHG